MHRRPGFTASSSCLRSRKVDFRRTPFASRIIITSPKRLIKKAFSMNADEYDVIIIGCGPVGAMAANLLGQANLKSLVIEREEQSHPLPRAVHLDHEIMRLFQDVGLTRDLLPLFREAQGHIHIGADGGVIRYLGTAGLHKRFGWANDYFFFQPELENILRVGFARFPNVEALYGTSVVSLTSRTCRALPQPPINWPDRTAGKGTSRHCLRWRQQPNPQNAWYPASRPRL